MGIPVHLDPRNLLARKAQEDPRFMRVVQFLDKDTEEYQKAWRDGLAFDASPTPVNADGLYYVDTRQPFVIAEQTQVVGTSEALLWAANFSSLVANYFTVGKMVRLTAAGKMTTASSSQGNLTLTLRYGTTTGGTSLAASAATALAASKSNISWQATAMVVCRATGSGTNGSLVGYGTFIFDGAGGLFTTASQMPLMFPATSIGATGVDTTSAQGIILDATLGSASDTMNTEFLAFEAMN